MKRKTKKKVVGKHAPNKKGEGNKRNNNNNLVHVVPQAAKLIHAVACLQVRVVAGADGTASGEKENGKSPFLSVDTLLICFFCSHAHTLRRTHARTQAHI